MALPTLPTITAVSVSGLSVTVTITGDVGGSYRVRLMNGTSAEDGDGITGSGNVVLTALGTGLRYLSAWGVDGVNQTEPTDVWVLDIPDTSDDDTAYYRIIDIAGIPGTPYRRATLERTERPTSL